MARLLAECFGPWGRPKKKYESYEAAASYKAEHPNDKVLQAFTIYECSACASWHMGHEKKAKRQ